MSKQNKFGTFGGVFVPSILTILGVIMYLRLPMIVGEAGLLPAIGIVIVAHIISFTTGLSVSSIATDKKVEAGGTYYMISRSLGLPIGGTLGLALFVGLSFSVSLYLIGFAESFLNYWEFSTDINNIRLTGTLVLLAVTTLTFISTSLAIKTQYFIMAAIALSLVSIFFGNHDYVPKAPLLINTSSAIPVMVLFGIFFPAVTGFEAGVSMSGDLKDPKRSIPAGSIMAITIGFLVYIGLAAFLAYTVSGEALVDSQVLLKISWIPELVIAGIWGATLSSALGSILGAPRILQATAVDKITPKLFSTGFGPTNEPRNALLLTFLIAEVGILIGELDVIARVVSIFFITTYGFLNVSAAFERWTSTDFKPEFEIPGWISLTGAIACILVMIQLDFLAMIAAVVILGLLFLYLKRRELTLDSGDAWSGVWASLVKTGLANLKRDKLHRRNWRPNTIMFSGNPNTRRYMIEIGKAISGKLGILSAFELTESDEQVLTKTESNLSDEKDTIGYFQHKLSCRDVYSGMDEIARVYGFSGVEPNTILMGWSKNPRNKLQFIDLLKSFDNNRYNSLFLNYNPDRKFGDHRTIDIWWSGTGRNLALAINLMGHITNSQFWNSPQIRLLIINPNNEESEAIYSTTSAILDKYREEAEIIIVNNEFNPLSDKEIISEESHATDLIILGIPDKKYRQLDKYYDEISGILEEVGSTLVINASDDFEEFEVISSSVSKSGVAVEGKQFSSPEVPALESSRFPEIATEIQKIQNNEQNALKVFQRKTFKPAITDHVETLDELDERIKLIRKELLSIGEIPDSYRKKKAIDKLKNEAYFKIKTLFELESKDNRLSDQWANFDKGITWYQERLVDDLDQYPGKLKIKYRKEDFKVLPDDRFSLKFFKRSKRLKHWFAGQPITHKVAYRKVVKYYLDNRQFFLAQLLSRFQEEETAFYDELRKIINAISAFLDQTERRIWQGAIDWNEDQLALDKLATRIEKEVQNQQQLVQLYGYRLQLEVRKNLQSITNDLEQIDINRIISKRVRPARHYRAVVAEIANFPEERQSKIKTLQNLILMELSLNAAKNRIETLHEDFSEMLRQVVSQKYLSQVDAMILAIKKEGRAKDLQILKIEQDFQLELQEAFNDNLDRMLSLTESMPETLEVYSIKEGSRKGRTTISIPVARMAEYYLRSRYEVTVEDRFEELLEFLKRSVYSTNDFLNLAQFSLENRAGGNKDIAQEEILEECMSKMEKEKVAVQEKAAQFVTYADNQFDDAFEPLSSVKIEESAGDFVSGLRDYQGQRVWSGLKQFTDESLRFFRGLVTKLFYSRSEGILLAQKLGKTSELSSSNSRLLDLKERVNPSVDILKSLPPYYVTLFNGRSNISEDFWIPRGVEEQIFNKAIKRYHQGFGGGILLLGDRNSGKTAFSRFTVKEYLKTQQAYFVFPPLQGDVSIDGFSQALKRATQIDGDVNQIFSRLPAGSILVINDVELFWERTPDGLAVIRYVEQLIDEYGKRVLFFLNMNPHAYRLINQITGFGDRFIEIVNFAPFDAEELKELVMKRHRPSGLSIRFSTDRNPLNEIQLAHLFNAYFDYSKGNPGTALNGWLANIRKVTADELIIGKPVQPPVGVLKGLNEDWIMLLTQFVLHKRLTQGKIERISGWESPKVKSLLHAMLRSGVIIEKAAGIYHPDPYIQPFLIKTLKEIDVL